MTKNKTMMLLIASFCLSVALALPVTVATSNSALASQTSSVARREINKRSAWEPNPAEVEVNTDKLSALTISSTITPTSHSFQFTFSTGGQGYSDTTSAYLVAPQDEDYQATYEAIDALDDNGIKALDLNNSLAENFDSIPDFNAYIFSISPTIGKSVILPKKISRNHLLSLTPSSIGVEAYDFSKLTFSDPINLAQDINIYIPNNINTVYEDSFLNLDTCATRVHFYVELSQAEVDEQWEANWNHGASVQYDYLYADHTSDVPGLRGSALTRVLEYTYDNKGNIVVTKQENVIVPGVFLARGGASLYGDKYANYFLGYFKDGKELPLYLEYDVELPGGATETRYEQFILTATDGYYNSVGALISSYSTTMSIDIKITSGETIDVTSLVIHNIFPKAADSLTPDETKVYYIAPRNVFPKSYELSDFIDISFSGISSFMDYTSIRATITKGPEEIYEELNPSSYRANEANIAKGKSYIRYRVSSLSQSQYLVNYGESSVKQFYVSSPISQYVLSSKINKVSYLFRNSEVDANFDAKSLKSLEFIGFYVTIDIYGKNGPLARSGVSTRFGFVNIMSAADTAKVFDSNALLIWLTVGFVSAYLLISIGLFFYLKERFKNDEFRRVKPKKYLFKASLGLLGSLIVILAFTFTTLRATLFANAVVVYNPVDPFIIVFMVVSVLIIGYFIRFLVVQTKAGNQRRKAQKLKLDQDKAEDGTN
ncbi:MAG TPA: hypothetical protein PKO28_01460 [Bacilli bacterium]|nr:hypothetical protein [Bacilli bacterium]HPS18853.1 hypothetical protein [Bacilli bacterium]